MNKSQFISILRQKGYVPIDNYKDPLYYFCEPLTPGAFDFTGQWKAFEDQLRYDGKWGFFASGVTDKNPVKNKISPRTLPIFGNSNRYVTKWFFRNQEDAIDMDLKDREYGLLRRAQKYIDTTPHDIKNIRYEKDETNGQPSEMAIVSYTGDSIGDIIEIFYDSDEESWCISGELSGGNKNTSILSRMIEPNKNKAWSAYHKLIDIINKGDQTITPSLLKKLGYEVEID